MSVCHKKLKFRILRKGRKYQAIKYRLFYRNANLYIQQKKKKKPQYTTQEEKNIRLINHFTTLTHFLSN